MKICFKNAAAVAPAIALVAEELGIVSVAESEAAVTVNVVSLEERTLAVTLSGSTATITYGDGTARFLRGLAMLVDWIKRGEGEKAVTQNPIFKTNGAMVDVSRKAVMRVDTVKTMMRKMALMGMNMYMLYTEDTYEIEGHPYFGYMRGAYTKAELKELDAYAHTLGIELIPCIQVLGHLGSHLKWSNAAPYRDTANVMLVGAEETYALIEDMLKTVEECFTTRRIHVGMDETADIGLGAYLKRNGYRPQQDIYFEHLTRIIEMTRAHGMRPMMWSDMFFRLAGGHLPGYYDYDPRVEFTDEVIKKIPRGVQQVFWDYYRPNEEFYAVNIDKHQSVFGKDSLFAGGVWCWSGHGPLFSESLRNTVPALDACRKKGVSEVIATVWHNGSESSLILSLAGLAWYADYDYRGGFDLESAKECFAFACGASYDDIEKCELCEHPHGGQNSASRAMLYNDPLLGIADKHIESLDTAGYYRAVSEKMATVSSNLGIFAPAYEVLVRLNSLLENKADFGLRLKRAYDAQDREALVALAAECDVIREKVEALRVAHRASWMIYNKPFGWEAHDLRYGGLSARFVTVKDRINAYLAGEIAEIEELTVERLALYGGNAPGRFDGNFLWAGHSTFASPQIL